MAVAAGTYAPSTNSEVFPINMKTGVSLVGAGAGVCTLDAEGTDRVIDCIGITGPTTTISGFTITNGHATGTWHMNSPEGCGGGIVAMFCSSLLITNNELTSNLLLCLHTRAPKGSGALSFFFG